MSNWWRTYPWREIQTNFREIDMLELRAEQVVADLQRFKATLLMINAAGIIASYPTELPYHFQSPYLTGDSLEQIIAACHAANIRVMPHAPTSPKCAFPSMSSIQSGSIARRAGRLPTITVT